MANTGDIPTNITIEPGQVVRANAQGDGFEASTPSAGGGGGISRTIISTSGNATAGATANTDYTYIITGAHTITMPTAVAAGQVKVKLTRTV